MEATFTPDEEKIRDVCRSLATGFAGRAADHDRDASAPQEDFAELGDAGLYGLVVPKEYGGWGAGFTGYVIAAEELAQGSPSTALSFNMHCVALALLVYRSPLPEETKRRIADLAVKDRRLICALFSEPGHSGLLYGTRTFSTRARRHGDGWVLNGKKSFATMAGSADDVVVFARPEDGPDGLRSAVPFLFPIDTPGVRIEAVWDTLGMRATRSDDLVFDDCHLPAEAAISEFRVDDGAGFLRDNEAPINLPYTAVYLGVGAAALEAAMAGAGRRVPRGYRQPLAYHPDVRRRVGRMSAELEAGRQLVRRAAAMLDAGAPSREALVALLQAKYVVGEAVAAATRSALEVGGAHATFKGSTLERLFRDGATATIMQPPGDVCLSELGAHELGLDPAEIAPPLAPAGG